MQPIDYAKRWCAHTTGGQEDWKLISMWLNDYAMEMTKLCAALKNKAEAGAVSTSPATSCDASQPAQPGTPPGPRAPGAPWGPQC